MATFWSVWETRLVIRGEDRRHQQGFAPLLTLADHTNSGAHYEQGFTLWNEGQGIALNVRFHARGRAAKATYNFPPGARPATTDVEEAAASSASFRLSDIAQIACIACRAAFRCFELF